MSPTSVTLFSSFLLFRVSWAHGEWDSQGFVVASVVKKLCKIYFQESKSVIHMKKMLLKGLSMLLS